MYISDILADSVAARDGRLRQGDQILQVNGRDVSTRDDTEQLFAENKNAVTLLVSRCLFTVCDLLLQIFFFRLDFHYIITTAITGKRSRFSFRGNFQLPKRECFDR